MNAILLIILIGLVGGVAVGLQSPMSSMITQRLGIFESVFIVHISGAIIALIPLLVYGSKLGQWRSAPWYTLREGFFWLILIASVRYITPLVGTDASLSTAV